jgi:SAM-dependent methyltransferase
LPIAATGISAIVLDRSLGMLRQARRNALRAGAGRLMLVVGDAERLPFGDQAFCGVICEGVLHHLPDVNAALDEADRVLEPGGCLCLAEPDAAGSALSRAVRGAARALKPATAALSRYKSPAAANERPLQAANLIARLEGLGYAPAATYLVHPPLLYRFLPAGASVALAKALNRGAAGRRGGDLVVIRAGKPSASP